MVSCLSHGGSGRRAAPCGLHSGDPALDALFCRECGSCSRKFFEVVCRDYSVSLPRSREKKESECEKLPPCSSWVHHDCEIGGCTILVVRTRRVLKDNNECGDEILPYTRMHEEGQLLQIQRVGVLVSTVSRLVDTQLWIRTPRL